MTTDLNPEGLDEIKARADAATEGPWLYADDGPRNILYHQQSQRDGSYIGSLSLAGVSTSDEDATFIAHARTDLPTMAAALTAVLDLLDKVADEGEVTTQADGVHVPVYLVRAAIAEHLPKEDAPWNPAPNAATTTSPTTTAEPGATWITATAEPPTSTAPPAPTTARADEMEKETTDE